MFALASAPARPRTDDALADLLASLRETARTDAPDATCTALRAADALIAFATEQLGRGGFTAQIGMDPVTLLQVDARRTFSDARMLTTTGGVMTTMPLTAAAFRDGSLSYAEVRGIVLAVKVCDIAGRTAVDALVGSLARTSVCGDDLLTRVDDEVCRLRADLQLVREDRAIDRGFLMIQGRLDGSGSIYGEADAASIATIVQALDAVADRPVNADTDGAPTRAQQRLDALLRVCEDSLNGTTGTTGGTRPRPRLLATIDLDTFVDGTSDGARLLWGLAGRAPRLSPLSAEVMLCDADVLPVVFTQGRPAWIGGVEPTIPKKLRSALIARDCGCRFPGCRAPAAWSDVHHRVSPLDGGATDEANCVLLCRRHHRYVHRYGWKIMIKPDGVIAFTRRGRTLESQPYKHQRP